MDLCPAASDARNRRPSAFSPVGKHPQSPPMGTGGPRVPAEGEWPRWIFWVARELAYDGPTVRAATQAWIQGQPSGCGLGFAAEPNMGLLQAASLPGVELMTGVPPPPDLFSQEMSVDTTGTGLDLCADIDTGAGVETRARPPLLFTPLLLAMWECDSRVADLLVAAGADPVRTTKAGLSLLHAAALCPTEVLRDVAMQRALAFTGWAEHRTTGGVAGPEGGESRDADDLSALGAVIGATENTPATLCVTVDNACGLGKLLGIDMPPVVLETAVRQLLEMAITRGSVRCIQALVTHRMSDMQSWNPCRVPLRSIVDMLMRDASDLSRETCEQLVLTFEREYTKRFNLGLLEGRRDPLPLDFS